MKFGIEVVGERCKARPEERLLEPPTFTALHSPAQPPSTPDTSTGEDVRSVLINGYDTHVDRHLLLSGRRRRPATVGANQFPSRACPVWGHSSSPGRDSLDFSSRRKDLTASISAARFEKGKKILISYYDQQGRTNAAPRSALVPLLKNGHADRNSNHFVGHLTDGHCGLGRESDSTVTISKVTDRLYHRSRRGSAVEKAFTHDFSQMTPSTDSSPEEERQFALSSVLSSSSTKASKVSTSMPSLNRSHPFLVTTPSSSQDSSNGNSSTGRTESHVRPLTTSPGKRVHFTVDESVKGRLRFVYAKRRAQTVIGGRRARGEGLDAARGRGKTRRKATVAPPVVAGAQEENGSPCLSKMYRKFRMIGHVTACLVRLQAAIEINSLDRTVRSASEIQWRTLYGQQESEKLAFNKSLFSRERVSTKMPRWALRILDVLPEDRTEQDCRRLHALFRGMRSFGKFTEQIQLSLCRAFSYTCVGESRIVLRRGHIGHNFYFVYSGSVFVNVQDVDGDGNAFIKTEAILGSGDSFGELALLQDIRRTATISVRETCELLVVEKDVFAKVCPKIFEKELMEKQSFISRLPLFSSKWWSAENLRSLCLEAQIQEYKINKIVVEDNAFEEWLYICMEGKCQVIRCLSLEAGDDDPPPCRSREPSVVLSEEIIELLASTAVAPKKKDGDSGGQGGKAENSKITLLSSLGLEYVHTGKRRGAFIEEIEMEERRKALLATHGPMTLTALMAQQQREGKLGLVYLDVGSLEAEGVFDMGSLIKTPVKKKNSSLLLVSSGARMLRIKKKSFIELASPHAVEHTRTLASKEPTPSETALLESYKEKVTWDNYKHGVVQDVMRLRERAAAHRDLGGKPLNDVDANSWLERSQTSTRLLSALNRFNGMDRKGKKGQGRSHSRDHSQGSAQSEDQGHSQNQDHTQAESDSQNQDGGIVETPEGDSKEQGELNSKTEAGKRIFPVIQLDSDPEDTPRGEDPRHHQPLDSVPEEGTSENDGDGKRPSAVIVRRRSSVGVNNKPNVSGETAFVMRRRVTSYHAPQISILEADPVVVTPEE